MLYITLYMQYINHYLYYLTNNNALLFNAFLKGPWEWRERKHNFIN